MNVILLTTYDGYASGQAIATQHYEGTILIARGTARQLTTADVQNAAVNTMPGINKRSGSPVTVK